ncbi:MAG: 16S rRNA (guanine(527)-N(7))-methyltransferase RsmG [Candidatus Accumulibacter sp.]|jgi:16S rRNA (guanine527-N7)-methyltransferase|nr:16S rRNA (guanine(527)-N(7))-methyltransferase RsmG [Accumulibacter sp.]
MNPAATQFAQLAHGLAAMGVELPPARREKLLAYLALLYKWNRRYRLTAIGEDEAVARHLLDSLSILPFVPDGRLLDVGSGGGAPGIPLAIARPDLPVTLLDGNSKKAAFLRQAAIELELAKVSVHGGRVEQYHPASGFSAIVARAFAELADFAALSKHLLDADGVWLAMKGVRSGDEIARLPGGVRVEAAHRLEVPGIDGERHLVVMRLE